MILGSFVGREGVSSLYGSEQCKMRANGAVLGIESLGIPIPVEPTAFCVELDNGIDYIKTSYMRLAEGARVNQEFAL